VASRDPKREQHWQSVLTQWHQSGQTISAFCRQSHLSQPAFGYWQRKLGFGQRSKLQPPAATFVPMTLVAEPRVEVVLPTGVILNPWSYLGDVLDQLAGRSVGDEVGDLLPDAWVRRQIIE
jgi:hypothetical protein